MKASGKVIGILEYLGFETYDSINHFNPKLLRVVRELKVNNWSRELLVLHFLQAFISSQNYSFGTLRIAVVGGGTDEPEILALRKLGINLAVEVFGIENDSKFLDLNSSNNPQTNQYDLVLCSQVIEHIWNLEQAFLIMKNLVATNGQIWISCPMSNRYHGSPEFYSAGYSEKLLVQRISQAQLAIIESGSFGSHRNYVATHLLNIWLSPKAHRLPLIYAFDSKNALVRALLSVRYLFRTLYLHFLSSRLTRNPRYATEAWILAKR